MALMQFLINLRRDVERAAGFGVKVPVFEGKGGSVVRGLTNDGQPLNYAVEKCRVQIPNSPRPDATQIRFGDMMVVTVVDGAPPVKEGENVLASALADMSRPRCGFNL